MMAWVALILLLGFWIFIGLLLVRMCQAVTECDRCLKKLCRGTRTPGNVNDSPADDNSASGGPQPNEGTGRT